VYMIQFADARPLNVLPRIAVLAFVAVLACGADEWKGYVYPDGNDLTIHREIGTFDSFEECRESARNYLRDLGAEDIGDYECGKNCKQSKEMTIDNCEETAD
jgi:hypothetical protein